MPILEIDIETYSSASLKTQGIFKYIEDPDFEVLMISYRIDMGEIITLDMYDEDVDDTEFQAMLVNPDYLKVAWNVPFEFHCLAHWYELQLNIGQWEDAMIKAAMCGYPMSLDVTAKAMDVTEKMTKQGKALIKYFTVPCKPTAANGWRTRNMPWHSPHKWKEFIEYNRGDVITESEIYNALSFFKIPAREKLFWYLDHEINERGIMLDLPFVESALDINARHSETLMARAIEITGIANPNSVKQLKEWLEQEMGESIESLTKENIKGLITQNNSSHTQEMLEIRQEMAKSSTKKYKPMLLCAGNDLRARGLLQFVGAGKTWRWSSRLIQIHNLPKNSMEHLHLARELAREGDLESLKLIFGNVPNVMSQLLRTAFIAKPDHELLVTDLSAIEARVLAWIAGEEWRLEVFRGDGKIYEASGARMFKLPIEEIVKEVRFKAKTAELALGFQGGVGAIDRMESMGLKTGLKDEEKLPLVQAWRQANKKIAQLWYDVEAAAIEAVDNPGVVIKLRNLKFQLKHQTLFIQLPSGRFLSYVKPYLKENTYGKVAVHYWGVDQKTKRWVRESTYGGKLVENIVQGTSRDVLAQKMMLFNDEGMDIVMHVHDEIVMETLISERDQNVKKAGEIMGRNISWAEGLPLAAVTYTTPYYLKD